MPVRARETREAEVFVTAVGVRKGRLVGVEWTWVPPFLQDACLGKTRKECEAVDHAHTVGTVTEADGTRRMVDLPRPNDIPYRVVSHWLAVESALPEQMRALAAMPFLRAAVAKVPPEEIVRETPQAMDRARTLRLRIEMVRYDNGTSYQVQEILP